MFSRGSRTTGRHARVDRPRREQARQRRPLSEELGAGERDRPAEGAAPPPPAPAPGPYDISQAPPALRRLDLGSLKIPSVPGVEVRVQAGQDGAVQHVYLVDGPSMLQLGVFAAPRTESIWDEVREEIRRSLFDDGVAAEETSGPYGTELRARVRTQEGLKDLRFVGVDGPRWMIRAVYQGPAATDPNRASRLAECLAGVVVDRDDEARPTKEPLPLHLPAELAAQATAAGARGPAAPADPAGNAAPPTATPATPAGTGAVPRRKPSPHPRRPAAGGLGPATGRG